MAAKRKRRAAAAPVKRPAKAARPARKVYRDARGRFLGKRAIAAVKGWQARRRQVAQRAKATKARRRAFDHGKAAREATERRLTPEQRARRKRDAQRIERKAKKDQPPRRRRPAAPGATTTKRTTTRRRRLTAGETTTETERPTAWPRLIDTSTSTTESTKSSTPKRRRTLTVAPQRSSGDALKVQIGITARLPAGMVPSNQLLNEAIAYRVEHGSDHPNFTTRIIRWQNPGRKRGELRQWRQGNQGDAWATLGPAISAAMARA
jgi:hypothetical protein